MPKCLHDIKLPTLSCQVPTKWLRRRYALHRVPVLVFYIHQYCGHPIGSMFVTLVLLRLCVIVPRGLRWILTSVSESVFPLYDQTSQWTSRSSGCSHLSLHRFLLLLTALRSVQTPVTAGPLSVGEEREDGRGARQPLASSITAALMSLTCERRGGK